MTLVDLTQSDYLAHKAYGAGDITKMGRSFAYWKYCKENPESPTRALVVGSATHLQLQAAITGDSSLLRAIAVYQDGTWRTKGFEKFSAENKSSYCLDVTEAALCQKMVKALTSEPEVMAYLDGAIAEPTIMGLYPGTDIMCKARPDYLHKGRGISIQFKTTTDVSESGFIYACKDYLYDWKSAFYIDLLSKEFSRPFDEVHILVEKTEAEEPCPVKIFTFGEDTIGWARTQIRAILERLPECERTGIWPGSPARLETLELPLYARKIVSL